MSTESLAALTHDNWQPFSLSLEGVPLSCQRPLRLLPGRRLACAGEMNGRAVFIKLFFGSGFRQRCDNEAAGYRQMLAAGVRVPQILATLADNGAAALVLEWLDGRSLSAQPPADWPAALADDFCAQLEQMYRAGLMQQDLHLDNFLVTANGLCVIDAGSVSHQDGLSLKARNENLALLCAQASLPGQAVLTQLVSKRLAGHLVAPPRFQQDVQRRLMRRIRQANKKWLRDCTAVRVESIGNAVCLVDRAVEETIASRLLALLKQPDQLPLIKQGSRISVYGDETLVLKHYRQGGVKSRFKRAFGFHPAQRSWRYGWTWALLGLPTPRPLALLLHADGSAVIAMPFCSKARYSELLEQQRDCADQLRPVLEQQLHWLAQAQLWHGDTKAQNILLQDGQPVWIDLDAAGWSARAGRALRKHQRDWQRFAQNWQQFREQATGENRDHE